MMWLQVMASLGMKRCFYEDSYPKLRRSSSRRSKPAQSTLCLLGTPQSDSVIAASIAKSLTSPERTECLARNSN